jgi:hypothetical protein
MAESYRQNPIKAIRLEVGERLALQPSGRFRGREDLEPPAYFWERVEASEQLLQALALFDKLEAEERRKARVPRETKRTFTERVQREQRLEEVERVRAELLASGLGDREAQEQLVARFQPLDGTTTRAWPTPNSWNSERLFRNKEVETELLRLAKDTEDDPKVEQAKERVEAAQSRQRERVALAAARRRALVLKARAQQGTVPATGRQAVGSTPVTR